MVISAELASLEANTRVIERFEWCRPLREQPCLHVFSDFQFLGSATFRFQLFGNRAAAPFDFSGQVVPSRKYERIPVHVFEAGERSAPSPGLLRMTKPNPALTPSRTKTGTW